MGFLDPTDFKQLTKQVLIDLVISPQHPGNETHSSPKPTSKDCKQHNLECKPSGFKPSLD
jgi:hypothetical protein